jgi:intracellular sulfur oxidation DsrE/DsrF family protein
MNRMTILLVTREGLGSVAEADRAFGIEMFDTFVHALETEAEKPYALCFYTDGVKLLATGSPAVLGLKLIEAQGVRLLACQTCLQRFGIADRLAVGQVATMKDIVGLIGQAEKVVSV